MTPTTESLSRRAVLRTGVAAAGAAALPAGTAIPAAATRTVAQAEADATGDDEGRVETVASIDVLGVSIPGDALGGSLSTESPDDVAEAVAAERSDLAPTDVRVRGDVDAIEVLADVAPSAAASAVATAYDASVDEATVRDRPTEATIETTADAVRRRLELLVDDATTGDDGDGTGDGDGGDGTGDDTDAGADAGEDADDGDDSGSGDGSGQPVTVERLDGATLRATVDGDATGEVEPALADREIRVRTHSPADADPGYRRETILTASDVASVGEPQVVGGGSPGVPVELTASGAQAFVDGFEAAGMTDASGWRNCSGTDDPGPGEHCLLTLVDDEVVFSGGVAPGLGEAVASGEFEEDAEFRLQTEDLEAARGLRRAVVAPLPAPVAVASVETRQAASDGESGTTGDSVPAPGVAGALAALGAAAWLAGARDEAN